MDGFVWMSVFMVLVWFDGLIELSALFRGLMLRSAAIRRHRVKPHFAAKWKSLTTESDTIRWLVG